MRYLIYSTKVQFYCEIFLKQTNKPKANQIADFPDGF